MKNLLLALLIAVMTATTVAAQTVQQSGVVTPGHVPVWTTAGVIQDGGTAFRGFLTSLGVTAQGPGICQNSAVTTAPYNRLCFSVSTSSVAQITLDAINGAPAESLQFVVNGVVYTLPPNQYVQIGDIAFYGTRSAAISSTIANTTDMITLLGYAAAGDAPPANYVRVTTPGSPAGWQFQSADGQWWELRSDPIWPQQLGAKGNGATDDTNAWTQTCNYIEVNKGGTIQSPPNLNYLVATALATLSGTAAYLCPFTETVFAPRFIMNGSKFTVGHIFPSTSVAQQNITNVTNNGGKCQIQITAVDPGGGVGGTSGYYPGDVIITSGILGATACNATTTVLTIDDATHLTLAGPSFSGSYTASSGIITNASAVFYLIYCVPCYYLEADSLIVTQSHPTTFVDTSFQAGTQIVTFGCAAATNCGGYANIGSIVGNGLYSCVLSNGSGGGLLTATANVFINSIDCRNSIYGVSIGENANNWFIGSLRTNTVDRTFIAYGFTNITLANVESQNSFANDVIISSHNLPTQGLTINYKVLARNTAVLGYSNSYFTLDHQQSGGIITDIRANVTVDYTGTSTFLPAAVWIAKSQPTLNSITKNIVINCDISNIPNLTPTHTAVLSLFDPSTGGWDMESAEGVYINNCLATGDGTPVSIAADLHAFTAPGSFVMRDVIVPGAVTVTNNAAGVEDYSNISFPSYLHNYNGSTVASGANETVTFASSFNGTLIANRTVTNLTSANTNVAALSRLLVNNSVSGQSFISNFATLSVTGGTSTYPVAQAFGANVDNSGTGTITELAGSKSQASNLSTGTVTTLRAYSAVLGNSGAGTVTSGVGYQVSTPVGATTGLTSVWTNISGIDLLDQKPSGAGTNTLSNPPVALHIQSQTASGAFAIQQLGSGINSFDSPLTMGAATSGLVLKQGANGLVGTFICTSGGSITVSNSNVAISDAIVISLNTAGGSVSTAPALNAITASTSFVAKCATSDTSTYNYAIIKNAA